MPASVSSCVAPIIVRNGLGATMRSSWQRSSACLGFALPLLRSAPGTTHSGRTACLQGRPSLLGVERRNRRGRRSLIAPLDLLSDLAPDIIHAAGSQKVEYLLAGRRILEPCAEKLPRLLELIGRQPTLGLHRILQLRQALQAVDLIADFG